MKLKGGLVALYDRPRMGESLVL